MAASKRAESFEPVESTDDEESFLPRDSAIVVSPTASPQVIRRRVEGGLQTVRLDSLGRKRAGKRSLEDMMAQHAANEIAQAQYAMERIEALEDQIAKVLELCEAETLRLILEKRPVLRRYAPDK